MGGGQGAAPVPAYLYLRLSSADGPDCESNSIQNQRAFLTRWAQENGFAVAREFADDGHTGTDFQRPGFRALYASLLQGGVRCLLVKDLSRLGRNYTETGRYLEEVFPRMGVRFIAVNDGYDSAAGAAGASQMAVFKNVFNDWYAQEASAKVRASLAVLKRQGKFLGTTAPYGYRIDPANRYHLLPDEMTAPVVRRIYRQFLAGQTRGEIAHQLTREGVPTPAAHRARQGGGRAGSPVWRAEAVRTILSHPVYRGDMAQQWTRTVSYKVHERRRVPPQERILVEGTHTALVSRETFALAQELQKTRTYGDTGHPHLLTGIAFCADCGAPMYAKKRGGRWYLNCYGYYRDPALHLCTSHSIREDQVLAAVLGALQAQAAASPEVLPLLRRRLAADPGAEERRAHLRRLEQSLERTRRARTAAYRDHAAGLLEEGELHTLCGELHEEEKALEAAIGACRRTEPPAPDGAALEERLRQFLRFEQLGKAQLHQLVRRVEVGAQHNLLIRFAFRAP